MTATITTGLWMTPYGGVTLENYKEKVELLTVSNNDMTTSGWIKVGTLTGEVELFPLDKIVVEIPAMIKKEINAQQAKLEELMKKLERSEMVNG